MDLIYLDNNATTRPTTQAIDAMLQCLTQWYANPSSVHRFGQHARQLLDVARGQVARLIGCSESELVFTGGGTESINAAIRGLLAARAPRNRIVNSSVEHSATRQLCQTLARDGVTIVEIPVDHEGRLDMDALKVALTDDTSLVSIMWANNETGVIFPVPEIARLCREKKIPFHCDATQAIGKIPVNAAEAQVDAMSFAAHKFHGVKGSGGLFLRRGLRWRPLIIGGPQERGRRGGTENVPGLVAMGAAAEEARKNLDQMPRVAALRDRLERGILQQIPHTHRISASNDRLPNTTNIGFERLEAEAILLLLSERGICASSGAACSSGSLEPSHVLQAMGIDEKIAHGAVRFSLSRYTTEDEIDAALKILSEVIGRLRMVMPFDEKKTA
jgi:cysteine desulfurase